MFNPPRHRHFHKIANIHFTSEALQETGLLQNISPLFTYENTHNSVGCDVVRVGLVGVGGMVWATFSVQG